MKTLLALAFGMLIGWSLGQATASWRRREAEAGAREAPPPTRAQLLAWLNAAPHGWLALDPTCTIQAINAKAEHLLQLPAERLLRGEPLLQVIQ